MSKDYSDLKQALLQVKTNSERKQLLKRYVAHEDWRVRCLVVAHGQGRMLDTFLHDKHVMVRRALAKRCVGRHLDVLVKDKSYLVRVIVATVGHPRHLITLLKDESLVVRAKLISRGTRYHANVLLKDKSKLIRQLAKEKLVGQSGEKWGEVEVKVK